MTHLLTIELPLPDHRTLGPNGGHGNHLAVGRARTEYRGWARLATLEAMARVPAKQVTSGYQRFELRLIWTLDKGGKELDDDNAKSVMKSGRDGIADALQINDRWMRWAADIEWRRGGCPGVTVRVYGLKDDA